MVEIKLYTKDGHNYPGKYEVEIFEDEHKGAFEKVTYSIKYKEEFPWLFWNMWPFDIYIRNKKKYNFYNYYARNDDHVVNKVEVYYSKRHSETPLIIGFQRNDNPDFKYFTYICLKNEGYSTGYPPRGNFGPDELDQKLEQENELRNKITFVKELNQSKNFREITDITSITNYIKYAYFVKDDESYGKYLVSPDLLFNHENNNIIDGSFFSKLDSQKFYFINAYYSVSPRTALLIEFDGGNKITYYQRNDFDGTFWVETTINEESSLETTLQKIEEESKKRISYHIDKKSNDNHSYKKEKIDIISFNQYRGFTSYTHTPSSQHKDKTQFLLFNKSPLKLKNVDQISATRLKDINDNLYSTVTACYSNSSVQGKAVDSEPPFLIELKAYDSTTKYYLSRLDREGLTWKQIENNAANINDPGNKSRLITQVNYYSKRSIVISLNKTQLNSDYPVNLLGNNPDIDIKTSQEFPSIKIRFELFEILPGSSYKCFTHDLSNVNTQSRENYFLDVSGLRLFITGDSHHLIDLINPIEINLYNSNGNKREYLYYNPSEVQPSGTNCQNDKNPSKLYVYFYGADNIPLLIYFRCKWYRSRSKDKYFQEWVEDTLLQSIRPDSQDKSRIKNKLDEINKEFNQIDISTTKGTYGISLPSDREPPKRIDSSRVKVETQSINLYIKINHTTVNNSSIGKLMYDNSEIKDNENDQPVTNLLLSSYNRVSVYYHKTNSDLKLPLLIGIGDSKTTGVFYERTGKGEKIRWNKVATTSLQQDGDGLAYKINSIHYNFNKSVIIQLEKQDKRDYEIFLVDNKDVQGTRSRNQGSFISVSKESKYLADSNYTCFKHTINLNRSIERDEIAGLKIYIFSIEIITYTINPSSEYSINYFSDRNEVFVYFYGNSKVPIFVCYNDKFYGPTSRDQYFIKWVVYGDISSIVSQLKDKLNGINKLLNQIELSNLKNNIRYGIPKPEQSDSTISDSFLNMIIVENCKNKHYRKVTHSTINKFSMGQVMHNSKLLSSVDTSSISVDHISVYYQLDDIYYSRPLLIKLWSYSAPDVSKWYYRTKIEATQWENEPTSKYDTDGELQRRLDSIAGSLFFLAIIPIDLQGTHYQITTMKLNAGRDKHEAEIFLGIMEGKDDVKVTGYRLYAHGLPSFYQTNKDIIKSKFSISPESDLTFELSFEIFCKKISLYDKQDIIISLYYTNEDFIRNRAINVYFYEREGYRIDTDFVPLLLQYKDSYYAPVTIENYFTKWKQLNPFSDMETGITVGGHADQQIEELKKEKLKSALDKINAMLNQIDLSKIADYGIPYCELGEEKQPSYQDGKLRSKRIQVTRSRALQYKFHQEKRGRHLMKSLKDGRKDFDEVGNPLLKEIKEILIEITSQKMSSGIIEQPDIDTGECKFQDDVLFAAKPCHETRTIRPMVSIQPSVVMKPDTGSEVHPVFNVHPHRSSSPVPAPAAPPSLPLGPDLPQSMSSEPSGSSAGQEPQKKAGDTPESSQISETPFFASKPLTSHKVGEPGLPGTLIPQDTQVLSENGFPHAKGQFPEARPGLESDRLGDLTIQDHSSEMSSMSPGKPREEQQESNHTEETESEIGLKSHDGANGHLGTGGDSENEANQEDIFTEILNFIENHKVAVYGGGGAVVTVAGSAYPLYKLIAMFVLQKR
ncbi:hypothetical protein MACJ_002318 [Theileria orientalis]|uniref:Uncharacterized protein n=1 Tax=Theileria orientalis TaxID=68886 RepID=A0A976QQH3_THEOR|nr:hypothetical protein MACJ_002318 [Theileria orientalis]